jgi:hypothetical protein
MGKGYVYLNCHLSDICKEQTRVSRRAAPGAFPITLVYRKVAPDATGGVLMSCRKIGHLWFFICGMAARTIVWGFLPTPPKRYIPGVTPNRAKIDSVG